MQKLIFANGGPLPPKKNCKCQPIIGSLMSGHDISEFDVFNLCKHQPIYNTLLKRVYLSLDTVDACSRDAVL